MNYLKHFTILLVEDNIECNNHMNIILEDKCAKLYSATNARDGLELYYKNNPDIIITANQLNGLSKDEMEHLLKDVGTQKPIIVTSTRDNYQELIYAISLGVKNYLFKPLNPIEVIHILENIAEQLYTTQQYRTTYKLYEQYKHAVDLSNIVTKTDPNGIITYVNKQFSLISGYSAEELIGSSHRLVRHPDSPSEKFKDLWNTLKAKKVWKGIIKNRAKDGTSYDVTATIMPLLSEEGEILEYIAIRQNITELLKQQELIIRQTTDGLTQLSNREKLLESLDKSTNPNLALINIDNFREINEFYGFKIGDGVLIQISELIKNFLLDSKYTLYKLPADEFAILIDRDRDIDTFQSTVIDLINELRKSIIIVDEHIINLTITMGIAHSKKNVLNNADIALRNARKLKKHYHIYDEESIRKEKIRENLNWHNAIKQAIKDNRIIPYFQPIYNIRTNKIEKYEALVRLIALDGDIVSPYFFLNIAKKYLQYKHITRIMIKQTFDYFRDKPYEFSLNISIDDILDETLVEYILQEINNFPNPTQIIFEITESEGIENYLDVENFLHLVKKAGCKIAIDDFGTGYSNFEHIIKLNVDYIKIDGSLIKNITTSMESKIVVETILNFSKKLGISTIAEFVSSKDIFHIIKELDADFAQGYYIGKAASNTLSSPKKLALESDIQLSSLHSS